MWSRLRTQLVAGLLTIGCLAGTLSVNCAETAPAPAGVPVTPAAPATTPAAEAPPAGDPPAEAAPKPDELTCGDDVAASTYRDLPKPFESYKAGEKKPMKVWYDSKSRRVFVEGRFCLTEGGIEFLAVADGGKTHESLLELYCRPQDILYAMLVCTYEPNNNLQGEGENVIPAGDPLNIYVEYTAKTGKTVRRRIEDFAFNKFSKKSMKEVSFAFTGSSYTKDPDTGKSVFLADMEKDVVTCFRTAWSVFNTPLLQGDNDTVYSVNKQVTPDLDTKCVMIITRGKPILKNDIDDNPDKVVIPPHANDGKMAQFQERGGKMQGTDDFTPVDPKKPASVLQTPEGR
ncbi:MAG TPA: YdjY domain-containing protein [Planctomycetota bacterium]|nr:YdjY domain-containing protein [Planctomycetota bacterium]